MKSILAKLSTVSCIAPSTLLLIVTLISMLTISTTAHANALINQMQGCQALLDFTDAKLANAPSRYPNEQVKLVRSGLSGYNQFIQQQIITPGLLQFNAGDTAKAAAMQQQVDAYKKGLVDQLHKRFKKSGVVMDNAIAINDCAKLAVPEGQSLQNLANALKAMVALSKN